MNQVEHADEQNADNRPEKNDQRRPGATDALFQQGNEGDPDAAVGLGIDLFEPGGDGFELDTGGFYRRVGSKPGVNFQARFPSASGAGVNGQWRPYRNGIVGNADFGGQHPDNPHPQVVRQLHVFSDDIRVAAMASPEFVANHRDHCPAGRFLFGHERSAHLGTDSEQWKECRGDVPDFDGLRPFGVGKLVSTALETRKILEHRVLASPLNEISGGARRSVSVGSVSHTMTSSSGFASGNGLSNTLLTIVKTVAVPPMPSVSVRIAVAVNPGLLISTRVPYRMSCQICMPVRPSSYSYAETGVNVEGQRD